jgi:hypothetical protein
MEGQPQDLLVEINGRKVEDVQATIVLPPRSAGARVYIDVRLRGSVAEEQAAADQLVAHAATHGGLVPLPFLGTLPWQKSSNPDAVRVRIGDLAAEASATETKLELVEA